MAEYKRHKFSGVPTKCIYDSDSFKVYAFDVDAVKYPWVKRNKYKNASVCGDIPDLTLGVEYQIIATEQDSKYGVSYKVLNIKRDEPTSERGIFNFLREVLTDRQATVLMKHYPNIIDLVKENRTDEIDISKLNGIGEKIIERIKNKIIFNFYLIDLVAEFRNVLSLSILKKIYNKFSSVDLLKERLKSNPYTTLTEISGIGFKTADKIVLELQNNNIIDFEYDMLTSAERCFACLVYLLEENESNGSTKANLIEIRKKCIELTPECADHFSEVITYLPIYCDKDTCDIALGRTRIIEDNIYYYVKCKVENKSNTWPFNIELYRNVNGVDLSDEQMLLLDSVCKNNFVLLTAPAGSGKSFSTKALINMLKDNGKSFILAAPTGKAAKKLSQYTGEQASTIHRTLGYKEGRFQYNDWNKLEADVIVIDEVGMTDIFLFKSLLEAVDVNTKIVLIGDSYQLNSVGSGALLRDLCCSKKICHITFNTVYRMGKGGVLTACTYVRQNKKFLFENTFTQIGEDKSYTFIPSDKEQMNDKILALYKKLLETHSVEDITVISSYNVGKNGCNILNQMLQPIANPNSLKSNMFVKIKQDNLDMKYYIGDKVIQITNNYHARKFCGKKTEEETFISNGTQGIVVDIVKNDLIINFDGETVWYSLDEIRQIKHAFALSAHKMQGSQNKIIIFCCPSSHIFFLSNNIIYTAISRAEERVYHFSDFNTINIAMNKSDSSKRNTFLGDMFKNF